MMLGSNGRDRNKCCNEDMTKCMNKYQIKCSFTKVL